MISEKTPLLMQKDEVVVVIPFCRAKECDVVKARITTTLTYEELLPYIIDPSWIRLRKICFTSFWIAFFVILLSACISASASMSNVSCSLKPATGSDNRSLDGSNIVAHQDASAGILSIVLMSLNSTTT